MFSDYEIQFSIGGFEDKWVSARVQVGNIVERARLMLYLGADLPRCRVRNVSQTRRSQEVQTFPIKVQQDFHSLLRASRSRPILILPTNGAYRPARCPNLESRHTIQLHPNSN